MAPLDRLDRLQKFDGREAQIRKVPFFEGLWAASIVSRPYSFSFSQQGDVVPADEVLSLREMMPRKTKVEWFACPVEVKGTVSKSCCCPPNKECQLPCKPV